MPYNSELADKIRDHLSRIAEIIVEEKKLFGGLAFMVNGKMCINASGKRLMCRYDPVREEEIKSKPGHETMVMKGRNYKGYCYVTPEGYKNEEDFSFWLNLCLDFNERAKSSKK